MRARWPPPPAAAVALVRRAGVRRAEPRCRLRGIRAAEVAGPYTGCHCRRAVVRSFGSGRQVPLLGRPVTLCKGRGTVM